MCRAGCSGNGRAPMLVRTPPMTSPSGIAVGARGAVGWALVRLPALAVAIYLLRQPILNAIEQRFDIFDITRFAIDLLSTPVTRFVAGLVFFIILMLLGAAVRRMGTVAAYVTLMVALGALLVASFALVGTSTRRNALVLVIFGVNLAPGFVWTPIKRVPRLWNTVMLVGVGIAELFLFREYYSWLRRRDPECTLGSAIPGLVITALAFSVLIRGEGVLAFEQRLRMPSQVHVIERQLSINWIELDRTGTYLYATGHDLPRLRRYDLRDLSAPPLISPVPTGGSQGFAYDPHADEIYVFNLWTKQLLSLDATTLEGKRAIDVPDLSPGDPWIVVDPVTDTLTIVSEADLETGVPFIVLNRTSGQVVDRRDLDAGNVLVHPAKPLVYLSFFRRRSELMLYDLEARAVTRTAVTDQRSDRIVFWGAANEVLVTSPMESRVLRFDADRLNPKGHIEAPFGARAIAIDNRRQLLLCGNIATGQLVVIDLRSGKWLREFYLGPWLRTIQVHEGTGTAYVSSNAALYRLDYASP
jgi:hypothetical protein